MNCTVIPRIAGPSFDVGQRVWTRGVGGYFQATIGNIRSRVEVRDVEVDHGVEEPRWVNRGWEYQLFSRPDNTDDPREWGWCREDEIFLEQPE